MFEFPTTSLSLFRFEGMSDFTLLCPFIYMKGFVKATYASGFLPTWNILSVFLAVRASFENKDVFG